MSHHRIKIYLFLAVFLIVEPAFSATQNLSAFAQSLAGISTNPALLIKRNNPSKYNPAATLRSMPESTCGANDLQGVNAYNGLLGVSQAFVKANKGPVGAMASSTVSGQLPKYCSGTLVGTNLFLTASHCVGTNTVGHYVSFNYENSVFGLPLTERFYRIASIVEDNMSLDFALIRLDGDPGAIYHWTDIQPAGVLNGSLIAIIQHPDGRPKEIEAGSIASQDTNYMYYGDLDTEGGSSGSGILTVDGKLVGVHTNGGCTTTTGGNNSGIRMARAFAISAAIRSISTGTHWFSAMGWCSHAGSRLLTGDFNGDGRRDMLCHDTAGNKWVALANSSGQFTGTTWSSAMGWCNHTGSQLFIGDFNGDGRDDMLCHDSAGQKWTALANAAGQFTGTSWYGNLGWCNHAGSQLRIGDFNGDRRDDMLCHDSAGQKWTALANAAGQFTGTNWYANLGWCNHAGSQLFIGDFNGDGRDDMLCHDSAGRKWTALANAAGQFTGTSWYGNLGWCNHAGSQLRIGDFNGDRRDDMLCHDSAGNKWTALANISGQFTGTTWSTAMGWCNHAGASLHIGKFNSDARSDMLCHDTAGNKWLSNARKDGSF